MQKKKSNNKFLLMIVAFTILVLVVIVLAIYLVINNKKCYKIEPRADNVLKYKANTNTDAYDINGWLRVQGTNIDYPVIYPDDGLDLSRMVEDFVWVIENEEELMDRTVILGHNIKNVSSNPLITDSKHTRFEQLLSFIYYDFAKDNQYIQYTKNGQDYLYQIFSVSFINEYDLAFSGNMNKDTLKDYITKAIDDSYFKYDVEVDENDKIISLITCTRFFGNARYRFKIDGKLLDNDEKAKLKKVTIKKNYEKIEDIMRGGEVNEENA